MRITDIKIDSFGGLESFELAPSKGITVIHGKNEAGKSTVGTFIKFALYGLPGRGKEVVGNEKLKFTPWSGKPPCGSLELETESGEKYRITRRSGAASGLEFTSASGENVQCEDDPGHTLLGIDRTAFEKSAFVGQSDISGGRLAGLSDTVRELLFSGEGDAAADDVRKRLTDEKNLIYNTSRKTGTLFELEKKNSELEEEIEKYAAAHRELLESEFKLDSIKQSFARNEEDKAALEKQMKNISAAEAKRLIGEMERLADEAENARVEMRKTEAVVSCGGFIPDSDFIAEADRAYYAVKASAENSENADKALADAKQRFAEGAKKYAGVSKLEELLADRNEQLDERACKLLTAKVRALKNAADAAHRHAKVSLCLFFLLITIPLYFYFKAKENGIIGELRLLCDRYGFSDADELERTLAVYPAVCEFNNSARRSIRDAVNDADRMKKAYERSVGELESLAAKCGREKDPSWSGDFTAAYRAFRAEVRETVARVEKARDGYRTAREKYLEFAEMHESDELEKKAAEYDETVPLEPEEKVRRNLGFVTEANKRLSVQIAELERETGILTGSIPNPTVLVSEAALVKKRISEETEKRDALIAAIEALDTACENIRVGAFPGLSERASELFSLMTDGKYDALTVSGSDSRIEVREKGSAVFRSADYLSAGAFDAAYVAVRLAFSECFCREKPPVVFDDSFARLDDKRLENVLRILTKLSDRYQIFILTCHDREVKLLENAGSGAEIRSVKV